MTALTRFYRLSDFWWRNRQRVCPVAHRQDTNFVTEYLVDDAIRVNEDLADIVAIVLRNHRAGRRERFQLGHAMKNPINNNDSVLMRIPRDVIVNRYQIFRSVCRPFNSHEPAQVDAALRPLKSDYQPQRRQDQPQSSDARTADRSPRPTWYPPEANQVSPLRRILLRISYYQTWSVLQTTILSLERVSDNEPQAINVEPYPITTPLQRLNSLRYVDWNGGGTGQLWHAGDLSRNRLVEGADS